MDLKKLERILKYEFLNCNWIREALSHPSMKSNYNLESSLKKDYQRLEFLGDSFLGFVIADILYDRFPDADEGTLAKYKSFFCKGSTQVKIAKSLNLNKFIIVSQSGESQGVRLNPKVLEDVLEAVIGAIYKDGGYDKAYKFIAEHFLAHANGLKNHRGSDNPKGIIQEYYQATKSKSVVQYRLEDMKGPDHSKSFSISLIANGEVLAVGEGNSKKKAEEMAASIAIQQLGIQ
tara:strand:+ start:12 stop:710 length:699 start_codon:yes stop_codon:yes gene_type:complete